MGNSPTGQDDPIINQTFLESSPDTHGVSSGGATPETQTAYQPSTGTDPSGRMDRGQRLEEIEREMQEHWTDDTDLLDTFFPRGCMSQEDIKHVKRELYDSRRKRWNRIPINVPKEKDLVSALEELLEAIRRHCDIGPEIEVLDTQDQPIRTHDGGFLKTDLFLSFLHRLISPAVVHESKPTSFRQCLAFIEGKRQISLNHTQSCSQLAAYAREILKAQSNRNFVPAILITERFLQLFIFDRCGALRSSRFDYHMDPDRACEIFFSLLHLGPAALGFDHTVSFKNSSVQYIRTTERSATGGTREVTYVVESLLMRSYTLVGSGTTYWRVRKEGDSIPSKRYIIKDSWRTAEMEDEQTLFRDAGDNDHIAHLAHAETVLTPNGGKDVTRHAKCGRRNRIHTRSVYRSSGKLLEHFENPMEVLISFYHAIKGHGLLLAQGVHFPDIVPWNILIPSQSHAGDCGALIDLDHARRADAPPSVAEKTPGSWFFLPRSALEGSRITSHIEYLESFFYIFCFIVVAHTGPNLASSRIKNSGELAAFGLTKTVALREKQNMLALHYLTYTVQTEYFKEPSAQLAVDLHRFLHTKCKVERRAAITGKVLTQHPAKDYRQFTAHIEHAIHRLAIICGKLHSLGKADAAGLLTGRGRKELAKAAEHPMQTRNKKRNFYKALGDSHCSSRESKRARLS